MKKLVLLFFIFVYTLANSQDTVFYSKIGGPSSEYASDFIVATDSTFYVLVNSGSDSNRLNSNIHVLEVNAYGKVKMTFEVGSFASEKGNKILRQDSVIIVAGRSNGMVNTYSGVIYGFTVSGIKLYEKYFSIADEWSEITQIVISNDTLLAIHEVIDSEVENLRFVKMNALTGQEYSNDELPETFGYHLQGLNLNKYGSGFLACGYLFGDSLDAFLMNLDGSFTTRWTLIHSLGGNDVYTALDQFEDSTIIVVGYSESYFHPDEDILIHRISAAGLIQAEAIQGYDINVNNKNDRAYAVEVQSWDSVYITGYTDTYGEGMREVFISLIDSVLNNQSGSSTFGTRSNESSIRIKKFGVGLVGIGYSEYETNGLSDALFWYRPKIKPTGLTELFSNNSYSIDKSILHLQDAQMSENNQLYFSQEHQQFILADSKLSQNSSVVIYNALGEVVFSNYVYQLGSLSHLKPGVYIAVFTFEVSKTTKKFLIH